MLTMFVVCVSIVGFFLFYRSGKTAGLREGATVTAKVVATMTTMTDKAFQNTERLNAAWDKISVTKDKIIASYVKENSELKIEMMEQVKGVFEEEDEEDQEEAALVHVAASMPSFDLRTSATTALELYDQITTANSVLDMVKKDMTPESYRLLKDQLQIPGGKHVDIKSAN